MAIYTIHLPRDRSPAAVERGAVLVRDGFAFWAMIFGPLWFLRHRQWLGLAGWLLIAVLIELSVRWLGAITVEGFEVILAIATGVCANDIRRLTLSLRGWSETGVVEGDGVIAAERRFFADWLVRPVVAPPAAPAATPPLRSVPTGVIGLFPESGVPQ